MENDWTTFTITGGAGDSSPPTSDQRDYARDFDKERRDNMRSLFRITVANPKTEEIEETLLVIAKDREGALLKAPFAPAIRNNADQYDFLFETVGDLRAKKDVQKVKVVKEEEE